MLGVKEVLFLRHRMETWTTPASSVARLSVPYEVRPDVIMTSDPYRKYFWHHDHRICDRFSTPCIRMPGTVFPIPNTSKKA